MLLSSRFSRCSVFYLLCMISEVGGTQVVPNPGAGVGISTRATNPAKGIADVIGPTGAVQAQQLKRQGDGTFTAAVRTHASTSGTTSVLYLCVGPSAACPTGYVMPAPPASALSMVYGQYWNGTLVITPSDGGALLGTTVIYDSYNNGQPVPICTISAASGLPCQASIGTTVGTTAGRNVITAAYIPGTADMTHTASTSSPVTITVLPDTPTATLVNRLSSSPAGQPATFTATVTGNYTAPTGPVVFSSGATVLGTGTLMADASGVSSTATLVTSVLPAGVDLITASYASTPNFAAASATFSETITSAPAGSYRLTVTPSPVSVGAGYSTLLTVMVTPHNGFLQDVNLSCANLPPATKCMFDTTSLANGGGTTNLVIATTAPHSCGTTQAYSLGPVDGGPKDGGPGISLIALPALAGLLAMFLPGRRRQLRMLIALAVAVTATQITGCGTSCIGLGTRPATYTFQVTASSTGTTEVESQPVTITVTN